MSKLTNKQELFVLEYLKDLNATQACLRAGYCKKNPSNADKVGPELLGNSRVAAAIQGAMSKKTDDLGISSDKILRRLDAIGDSDIGRAYDDQGRLLHIQAMPEDLRKCIASIKVFEEFDGFGKDRVKIGETREIKFWDKIKANELLGKYQKLWIEKVEHTGADGGAIVVLTMPSNGSEALSDKKPEGAK